MTLRQKLIALEDAIDLCGAALQALNALRPAQGAKKGGEQLVRKRGDTAHQSGEILPDRLLGPRQILGEAEGAAARKYALLQGGDIILF